MTSWTLRSVSTLEQKETNSNWRRKNQALFFQLSFFVWKFHFVCFLILIPAGHTALSLLVSRVVYFFSSFYFRLTGKAVVLIVQSINLCLKVTWAAGKNGTFISLLSPFLSQNPWGQTPGICIFDKPYLKHTQNVKTTPWNLWD